MTPHTVWRRATTLGTVTRAGSVIPEVQPRPPKSGAGLQRPPKNMGPATCAHIAREIQQSNLANVTEEVFRGRPRPVVKVRGLGGFSPLLPFEPPATMSPRLNL